jgi:phosphoserine phosphatase RsbU/P
MLEELFLGLLNGSFMLRFLLLVAAAIVSGMIAKNDTEGLSSWVYSSIALFVIRDLLHIFFPVLPFVNLFNIAIPLVFAGGIYRKKNRTVSISIWIFGVLAISALVFLYLLNIIDVLPIRITALVTAVSTLLLVRLYKWESANSANFLHQAFIFLALGLLLVPSVDFIKSIPILIPSIAIPVSYILLLSAIVSYIRYLEQKILEDRDYLSDTIDSLYRFILKSWDSMKSGSRMDQLTDYVARTIAEETEADSAAVFMTDDFEDLVICRSIYGEFAPIFPIPSDTQDEDLDDLLKEARVPLGQGLIGETAQSGKAVFIVNVSEHSEIPVYAKRPAGSLICVPLMIDGKVIGVCLLIRNKNSTPFTDVSFDRASLLCDFASLTINNAFSFQEVTERTDIDTAAGIAADIQKTLLPKRIKDLPTVIFGAFSTPARGVCGDYYDVIVERKDKIYLVMGDVAGKGVPASLIMVMIRAILHLVTNANKDAATILNWINRGITGRIDLDHFATLQILIYNPLTGECEFANAGHKPPLIWKQSTNLVDAIEMHSVPIGVEKATIYNSSRFTLENNDIILMYTDGVIESMNSAGKQYGLKNLTAQLHKHHDSSAKDIAANIGKDVQGFVGNVRQHDDQTLLVMKAKL